MTTFSEDFEGISDTTALTTSNTSFDNMSGTGSFTASTTYAKGGTVSGRFNVTVSKTARYDSGNQDATDYVRFYIRPVTNATIAATAICQVFPTGTTTPVAQIRASCSGSGTWTLQMRDKYADVGSAQSITVGEWARIEWKVTANTTNGQQMRLFKGNDLENAIDNYTAQSTGNALNNGTYCGRFNIGPASDATMEFYIDDVALDSSTWCGSSLTVTEKSSTDSGQFSLSTESAGSPLVIVSPTDSGQLGLSTESKSFAQVDMARSDSGIISLSYEGAADEPVTGETSAEWYIDIKPRVGVW